MIRQPSRHCTVELQALPARIGHVRRIVSAQLRYWHLDALIDPAALGVSELLANVHRHARPSKQCTVELYALLDQLTVSVHDRDPRLPRIRDADSWETSGRGLSLIAALSDSWGMHPDTDGQGKVVWFTLPALTAVQEPAAPPAHWEPVPLSPAALGPAPLEPAPAAADPLPRTEGTKVG
ncbi:ATP-binding protein [Streptomyces sp. NPDC053427]|uniref:ATP-binding protein n=1 Tax=Streptomyces sp. NPDC053427 TaxID=3365701 RepID=UPI0037D95A77